MPVDWTKTAAEIERDFHEIESQLSAAQERVKKAERDSLNYGIALENAKQELAAAESSADQDRADAERLDALQAMTKGYGKGWILRDSTTGRGMRLHETSQDGAFPSVRAAIDAARATQKESEKENG